MFRAGAAGLLLSLRNFVLLLFIINGTNDLNELTIENEDLKNLKPIHPLLKELGINLIV